MKILQINSVCGVGSTGKIAQNLYHGLKAEGHECKIAWGRRYGGTVPLEDTIRIGSKFDHYRHGLATRLWDRHGFAARGATQYFLDKVEKYAPDIIHLHNIHGYYIHIGLLFHFLSEYGKPVVWTLHDCWSFTGHCSYFDFVGCAKWKVQCHDCTQTKSYPKSLGYDNSIWNYQKKKELFTSIPKMTLVSPSHWLAGLVKQSFLAKYPIEVIHNGIDRNIFKPTPSNLRERFGLMNKKIVLGVANVWSERKGFNDMLKLADLLPTEYQIVMVGVSKKQKDKLPQNILGIIRTDSPQELAQWYTTADVFVNPTYEDNFPTVNLEAQACGTPVVTYDSGGSPECVVNAGGRVCRKKGPEGIITILVNLGLWYKHSRGIYEGERNDMGINYIKLYNKYN